jgi:AcrR family transcriptional regulator
MAQTGTEAGRKRAPAMSIEDRRLAIVSAALPLLVEHGGSVTTSQIAAAAGIAEGTVFRAFKDKRELFVECLRTTMRSEPQVAEIEAVDAALPLAERLIAGVGIVSGYQQRLWSMMEAIRASGIDFERADFVPKKDDGREATEAENHPEHGFHLISVALAGLFGAEKALLRVDPELAARLLLGLMFTNHMQNRHLGGASAVAELPELIDLFLHGTVRDENVRDDNTLGGRRDG